MAQDMLCGQPTRTFAESWRWLCTHGQFPNMSILNIVTIVTILDDMSMRELSSRLGLRITPSYGFRCRRIDGLVTTLRVSPHRGGLLLLIQVACCKMDPELSPKRAQRLDIATLEVQYALIPVTAFTAHTCHYIYAQCFPSESSWLMPYRPTCTQEPFVSPQSAPVVAGIGYQRVWRC